MIHVPYSAEMAVGQLWSRLLHRDTKL